MRFLSDQDVYQVTIELLKGLGHGVILLRMEPVTIDAVHRELEKFLKTHGHMDLRNHFVVIEPGRHRIRISTPVKP